MSIKPRCTGAVVIAGLLPTAACGGGIEPLSTAEAQWCRLTLPGFMLVERGESIGVDLTEVVQAAREAEVEVEAAGRDIEARMNAFLEVLEANDGYIELCRSHNAGR